MAQTNSTQTLIVVSFALFSPLKPEDATPFNEHKTSGSTTTIYKGF